MKNCYEYEIGFLRKMCGHPEGLEFHQANIAQRLLEILKTQEQYPELITLTEVESIPEVVWVERDDAMDAIAGIPLYLEDEDTTGCQKMLIIKTLDGCMSMPMLRYGNEWRCWTARPSISQREATPWK